MITLGKPKKKQWLDLPRLGVGVRVRVRPLNAVTYEWAVAHARRETRALLSGPTEVDSNVAVNGGAPAVTAEDTRRAFDGLPIAADADALEAATMMLISLYLALIGIEAWKGIDGENGKPAPVNPATVRSFIFADCEGSNPRAAEEFREAYLRRYSLIAEEKKSLPRSRNGTSAGAGSTAQDAPSSTSPARRAKKARTGDAARTSRTSRARRKAPRPGA